MHLKISGLHSVDVAVKRRKFGDGGPKGRVDILILLQTGGFLKVDRDCADVQFSKEMTVSHKQESRAREADSRAYKLSEP